MAEAGREPDPIAPGPEPRLPARVLAELEAALVPVDALRVATYPGDGTGRQPIHTVYLPVDRVESGLSQAWGDAALGAVAEHAAAPTRLADLVGLEHDLVGDVWPRMLAKLEREPIEDLRVDAEDGYRGSPEREDGDVLAAARFLAADVRSGHCAPSVGIRAKCMEGVVRARGLRSLDLFLGELIGSAGADAGLDRIDLVVTLPKITDVSQVTAMTTVLAAVESEYGLPAGRLGLELQVETPQAVLGSDGRSPLAPMVHAAGARCRGLHYGTYDYSAALGIAAAHQRADHPAADHAKAMMQVAVAGTRANVVDGSTNILPVGSPEQVHEGWRVHGRLVRRALERGFYQGWDLHPAQLVTRYLVTYAFFRQAMPVAVARLRAYVRTSGDGNVLDEPATARALSAFLLRGLDCGALDEAEVRQGTGLDRADLEVIGARSRTGPAPA